MLSYLDDIESDLSRFHRVKKPYKLSSSRYFKLAERLPYYEGVVRMKMLQTAESQPAPQVQPGQQEVEVSLATILGSDKGDGELSVASGLEYSGG